MELTRVDTIVQFTPGSSSAWNNASVPVPAGAVVIDTINKVVKEGDGNTLFANLPVCLDYNFGASTSGAVQPVGDDAGAIARVANSMYSPSSIDLTDILADLVSKDNTSTSQQSRIEALSAGNLILTVAEGTVDGTIVVCSNGKYGPGTKTLAQLVSDLIARAILANNTTHIEDLEWYSDSALTNKVITPNDLTENSTYWCKIKAFNDVAERRTIDFGLSTTKSNVTITNSAKEETAAIIAAVYGGTNADFYGGIIVSKSGNIFVVGRSDYTTSTTGDGLIVKYDKDLNILAKKTYSGANSDMLRGIAEDSNGNIYAAGNTDSEGSNSEGLILKFDANLNSILTKRVSGSANDWASSIAIDNAGNVFVAGTSNTGSSSQDGLILKLDANLNVVAKKFYGGTVDDQFRFKLTTDAFGNVICVGLTTSEGRGSYDALIVKFDNNLNIVARKIYGGTGSDEFASAITDAVGNIYAVGLTSSEGIGTKNGLIVKFAPNLSILARKVISPTAEYTAEIYDAVITSLGEIVVAVTSMSDTFILKLDSSLNITSKKRIGGYSCSTSAIVIDTNDNLYVAGQVKTGGTNSNGFVVKLPASIPAGLASGSNTGIAIADTTLLTSADSVLTLADSTGTVGDSTVTIVGSTLTLANSALTAQRDVITAARTTVPTKLITTVYTGSGDDIFTSSTTDSAGNIIAVGSTIVAGTQQALVVKFDATFTTIARKLYGGNYSQTFNSVICDASNNVICVGSFTTSSGGLGECFIVKFNSGLTAITAHKSYGAAGNDVFNDVIMDPSGNFIAVGYTTSEGSGLKDALVVKFNATDLSITAKKRYGGTGNEQFNGVAIDSVGNAVCVGSTTSEGANGSGLVVKLDSNLNIVLRKIYNSTLGTTTEFNAISITAANVMYCVGRVVIAAGNKGLVVKFDSSLNMTIAKVYGNTNGSTEFTGVTKDSSNNVICVGKTNAEGAGSYDALILKMSSAFSILGRKTYGTVGADADIDCCLNATGDILLSGYSVIAGSTDAIVTKLPSSLPIGVYTNKYFTDLILSDSKLTLSDDTAVVSSSTLTLADSGLTLTNNSMLLTNATGAVVTDTTIMDAISNVFKVEFGAVVSSGNTTTADFNVVANDGINVAGKSISVNVNKYNFITTIYGGLVSDTILATAVDTAGNIYAVGYSYSEGTGSSIYGNGLIIKFDANLNILIKKIYSGSYDDIFTGVVIDTLGNIFVSAYSASETTGVNGALMIKFDADLNIVLRKRINGTGADRLLAIAIDTNNCIVGVGDSSTSSFGNTDALIIKLDNNLNVLLSKHYGGLLDEQFLAITADSSNNYYAVGYTLSEGIGDRDGLIVKFDQNLTILAKKRYGGTGTEGFTDVAVSSTGDVYVIGYTTSENSGRSSGLVIKLDSSLAVVTKRLIGRPSSTVTPNSIVIIPSGGIVVIGSSGGNAVVVKLDSDMNIVAGKFYDGPAQDAFVNVLIDSAGSIVCGGFGGGGGSIVRGALIVKLAPELAVGTFTGSTTNALTMSDATLTLSDSNLNLADSQLQLAAVALTSTDSTLTLSLATQTSIREVVSL